jgi:hypothetical protein
MLPPVVLAHVSLLNPVHTLKVNKTYSLWASTSLCKPIPGCALNCQDNM